MEQVKFGFGIGNFRAVGQKVGWVNLESGTGDSLLVPLAITSRTSATVLRTVCGAANFLKNSPAARR